MKENIYDCYLVTDERYDNLLWRVERLLNLGITMVQYRAKYKSTNEMYDEAKLMCSLCHRYAIPFLVNDRADIALAVRADGVHLGQNDLPCSVARNLLGIEALIGITVHNVIEAQIAERDGANYLGAGAVFPTQTKNDVELLGLGGLRDICKYVDIPVVAIGGVNSDNKQDVLKVGATGVAMVTSLLGDFDKNELE